MYTIYSLVCPVDKVVRYIGCTKNIQQRYNSHIRGEASNKKKWEWIKGLLDQGLKPVLNVLFQTECVDEAKTKEHEFYLSNNNGTLICANPEKRAYIDLEKRRVFKDYCVGKFFVTLMTSRIIKTKSFHNLKPYTQKDILTPSEISHLALDIEKARVKGLDYIVSNNNIPIARRRIISDLLTNNLINN